MSDTHTRYRERHREEIRAKDRAYYAANRDRRLVQMEAYRGTAKGMTRGDRYFLRKAGVLPPYRSDLEPEDA